MGPAAASTPRTSHITREQIVALGNRLPPSLGIFGRLQAVLRDANNDLDDIVQLINVDPALTFQVIKLSNSAIFGIQSRCESIEQAVARVGFGNIQQLVGLAVARQAFQGALANYEIYPLNLWENAVATSSLMAAFAERAGSDAPAAHSIGLLRTIGTVILNNWQGAVRYPGESAFPDVHSWERATYGMTAAEVSAVLLDHWRFSAETVDAVRGHLVPAKAGSGNELAARLHLSCALTDSWGYALNGEHGVWHLNDQVCILANLTEDDVKAATDTARTRFDQAAQVG